MSTHHTTLGAILGITTGRLVSSIDELFALQDFLVGRPLMIHERATGIDRQASALLAQFPQLAEATPPSDFAPDENGSREASCRAWVQKVADHIGWSEADVESVPGCEVDAGEVWSKLLTLNLGGAA